jgi:cytochrome P450 family 3 subfamily A
MSQRSGDKVKHHDFLQLMINAQKKIVDEEPEDKSFDAESHHGHEEKAELVSNKSKIDITENDILANSFVFFLAGYETTASLLSFLFYSLAIYPECQEKLLEEVLQNRDENGQIDYDTIVRMPYLDACVSETLRLYNPAGATSRTPSEDYKLGEYYIFEYLKNALICILASGGA